MERISCYGRTVTFSPPEQRTSPVSWTAGRTCFQGRGFLKESGICTLSRFGWFGPATGQQRLDLFAKARMRIAHCSSTCLTPRWRGTRRHRTGQQPGCMRFLQSIYCYWCYARSGKEGASVILTAPNWPNQPCSPDLTELLVALPWPIPVRKDLLSSERFGVATEPRVVEPSCLAASGISEELSVLHSRVLDTLSEARAPSTRRLYALKWKVFVKWSRMFIPTRLLAPCRMLCIFHSTDWIVDLYHQHWKCMWPLLPRFIPYWRGNRSVGTHWWWVFLRERGECIPRVHLQSCPGALMSY